MEDTQVLYSEEDKEILKYFLDKYPEEACGILQNKKGKLIWIPSTNEADDKENHFIINSDDYLQASLTGDIYAVVHSHPDASAELSEADKKASDYLGVRYIVYSIPDGEKVEYIPKKQSLLGRKYEFGKNDCYVLARDFYKEKFNINLPIIQFKDNWWDIGLNYFDDLFEEFGFVEVEEPQFGDLVFFKVFNHVPNHCGVYLEEDIFMHHAVDRLSCRESLYPLWIKKVSRYVRYAKS